MSTPDEQGMDSAILKAMLEEINRQNISLDSVLVLRHGAIVLEQYYQGYKADSLHDLYSVTKSFVSAMVGIAIDQGLLKGVEQKAMDFFPGQNFTNPDPRKSAMTMDNILTMSTGLAWNEGDPEYRALYASPDWVANMLSRSIVADPGSRFNYCSGCSHLLSAIIQQVAKVRAQVYADQYLFQPLGITRYTWEQNSQGVSTGGWGLKMAPRDLAKLGYLYLQKGKWGDQQIIASRWVETSTRFHISTGTGSDGYGYQWWIFPDLKAYAAMGRYGQMIFVRPESDLVVVFTAMIRQENPELDLIKRYIIPAITK